IVACKIKPNGQSYLVQDKVVLESDSHLNDFTIFEILQLNKQHEQKFVFAIVNFVFDGKILGEPYFALFYKDVSYEKLCFELMKDGAPLLPEPYFKMNLDFKLHLLDSDGSVYCTIQKFKQTFHRAIYLFNNATFKPFLNNHVEKVYNKENTKNAIFINVEWDLSLRKDFESKYMKEQICDDYSLQNKFNDNSRAIPLITLLDNFVKSEPIQFWNCPKCNKLSGTMQINFEHLPDILVFYLKRFDTSGEKTKKNANIVYTPEELDMSSYFNNENKYYLSCVIYHHGTNFTSELKGHYTAAARNFIDGKWRLFNDTIVSIKSQNQICSSDDSYMLIYQRKRSVPWFPKNVPCHIIKIYQREMDKDDKDYAKQRNKYSHKQNNHS
uniref:ubiquitinyl hydrolase 1 n=1 Tax=Meloidogyne javanica TaxID=6303 RepID=A0A915LVX9_MELJA